MTVYRLHKRIQHFCSTDVPKLTPRYGPGLGHDPSQNLIKTCEVFRVDQSKMGQFLGIFFLYFVSSVDLQSPGKNMLKLVNGVLT